MSIGVGGAGVLVWRGLRNDRRLMGRVPDRLRVERASGGADYLLPRPRPWA